jgi:hypothetical protein
MTTARILTLCASAGPATLVVTLIGWLVAGVLPTPLGPDSSVQEVVDFYSRGAPVLAGLVTSTLGVSLVFPLIAVIGIFMWRMEGRTPILTIVQLLTGPIAPFIIQNVSIGLAILNDERRTLPRWVGYLNFWIALAFVPDVLAFFFHGGPFGWRGLFIFWLALAAYSVFLVVMGVVLRNAIRQSASHAHAATTLATP